MAYLNALPADPRASRANFAIDARTDAVPANVGTSWVDKTLDIGKGLLALKQQSDIMAINRERLAQGLSPIDASDMGAQVKVGMDKAQLNKILFVGGGVILALGLMFMMAKKRR